ncbi:MAG: hypothetical protein QOF41_1590 [Methylobacteriaceae bacterium]|nr:hypothetical protein [Methylobacteriaceae bacterium]
MRVRGEVEIAITSEVWNGAAKLVHIFSMQDPHRNLAAAYIGRVWQPARVKERYDWLFVYDPITAPI